MLSNPKPYRILVINDDGIQAPGLALLESISRELSDDVWVVAPSDERSGAGHSVSLTTPIRMHQLDEKRYQVNGTLTDCVLMALWQIMPDKRPNVLLSGINTGANLVKDVTYSGTCAAAMEGTLAGIRSIALSEIRSDSGAVDFASAALHGPVLVRKVLALDDWRAGSFFNINFPLCSADAVTGTRITTQRQRPPGAFAIDTRHDARNHPYFWVKIRYPDGDHLAHIDLAAVAANEISVTLLKMDLTDHCWTDGLADLCS